jgi:nucleoside-diphosphate-sugar epimerase
MNVLITGANGFVGRALSRTLLAAGHQVTGIVRRPGGCIAGVTEHLHTASDFDGLSDNWPGNGSFDCVIHLAARVHVMHDKAVDPDAAFRASNVFGTLRVAHAAAQHQVPRFVFLSSIKAVDETDHGTALSEESRPAPQDAYGRSKLEAEKALTHWREILELDTVIVRPPLVYGPGVRANFLTMMKAVARGFPLPLGLVKARRSMVYVDNLADALMHCATDPRARHGCFHVADEIAPTVAELLAQIGYHLGRPARLLPVPVSLLKRLGRVTGRSAQIERLTGDLRVDSSLIRATLGWRQPYSSDAGLAATAHWLREQSRPSR